MKHAFLLATVLCPLTSSAQEYWQQKVDTRIEVTLDDQMHMLRGYEELQYFNNSPDTLQYIYLHLWPNAYKHDHTQYAEQQYRNGSTGFYYAKPSERGYIDSLEFSVNDKEVLHFTSDQTPDIARIDLPTPLPPGGQVKITTPFRVKLPKVFSRLGHNMQAYFISQWFPKPAVYDRKGWHPMPYLDLGEFYSEFGSYDVKITLPSNYVVMGTGNILNPEEIQWLDELASKPAPEQKRDTLISSSTTFKTVHFKEENVHDFAWFADKRWMVRKDTITSPGSGDLVTVWAAFLPSYKKQWSKATEHLKNAIRFYGKWVGPYPYKTMKVVQGDMKAGGGMEYPTITVIDINAGEEMVIVHEAGHNWFYGVLASNERDHAWMDEGLNTFYEQKTTFEIAREKDTLGKIKDEDFSLDMQTIMYQLAAAGRDQPIDQTSNNFRELNYGVDVYYKTASYLLWLENYMGKEQFQSGIQDYYNTWKFKHPYPEDFRTVMQKHTNKPIDWFFEEVLKTDRLIDFKIADVRSSPDGVDVTVRNKTSHTLPVAVGAYAGDSLLATGHALPFRGNTTVSLPATAAGWTRLKISPFIPDGRTPNNEYRKKGLFHRSGLRLAPFVGTNLSNKQKLFILPALGYNLYDGFQAGLLLHNLSWPQTKFRFALTPLHGFRSKNFNGAGSIGYNWFPQRTFKEVMFQADFKSFSYQETERNIPGPIFVRYMKLAPSVNLTLRQASPLSTVRRTITLKGYAINEESFDFNMDPSDSLFKPSIVSQENYYGLLRYTHNNDRTFNPFSYSAEVQIGENFAKINLEGNLRIDYHSKDKSLYIRAFGGKFISLKDEPFVTDRYYLNTTFTGPNDYLYDDTYIGRSEREGFGARQISMREGGFKIPTPLYADPLGRSDNWLVALNLKTDLPLKRLPIRLYMDVASFADAAKLNPSGSKILYNGGVEIHFLDILNIYLPLVMSKDFKEYQQSISGNDSILDGITFSLSLHKINWLKAPSGVLKLM